MNIGGHLSFLYVGASFGYIPRGLKVVQCPIFEEPPDRFPEWFYQLSYPPPQKKKQWKSVHISPGQHLLPPEIFTLAILCGVR